MFTLKEESQKIRADAKLDINLERSRVTDMVMCTLLVNILTVYISIIFN